MITEIIKKKATERCRNQEGGINRARKGDKRNIIVQIFKRKQNDIGKRRVFSRRI